MIRLGGGELLNDVGFAALTAGGRYGTAGDRDFDVAVRVDGPPEIVAALLTETNRARLRSAKGIEMQRGELSATVDVDLHTPVQLEQSVRELTELTEALQPPLAIDDRLYDNAVSDPTDGVRAVNLRLLQGREPETDRTRAASRAALTRDAPSLVLAGAMHLGDEGLEAVERVAGDEDAEAQLRTTALDHLVDGWSERARPVLRAIVRDSRVGSVLRLAVHHARSLGAELATCLAERATRAEPSVLLMIAEVLGAERGPVVESALLDRLQVEPGNGRVLIARALGLIGTKFSVVPLRKCSRPLLNDPTLARESRAALSRVQARLRPAEEGGLSISADADGGSLSFPRDDGGLSFAESAEPPTPPPATVPEA